MKIQRREFLMWLAASTAVYAWADATKAPVKVPRIGMGTWITFNVGRDQRLRDARTEVLREFFKHGGGMIDSSPMYGSSEEVVGYALKKLNYPKSAFTATKVWTSDSAEGLQQMKTSQDLWGVKKFDLMQIHNLDGWKLHLPTLMKMKAEGQIKYVGITTSHGRRHDEFEKVMREHPLDFVQLTYNMVDRDAEKRLLGLAKDRNIAVIANRPFDGGDLMKKFSGKPLPAWASEFECANWAEFFLKFVVSHPAVTCAIPATSRVDHMRENMGASRGRLPDVREREKMIKYLASL